MAGPADSPRPAVELVARDELISRFAGHDTGGVTLVCAPAGSGKTVLVREWVRAEGLEDRFAAVSVERGERDAQSFWLSVIDALAGVVDEVQRVEPAPDFRGDAVVDRLREELRFLDATVVLSIDDLHELNSADAWAWLDRFLSRLPPHLLVVLATREDPRLGLHRLRLTGELVELRAGDLRFSLAEARQLLSASGITLSDQGLALLHERTQGWAAGLRLAAISLARHPDPERFVTEFSGSERMVAGYLLSEVLERQPADVRELLLRTSILDRVNGPLADHLLGGSGSERILQELEDANAFVTAEDASRSWFRYHHLFADLLRLELRRDTPDAIVPLHLKASEWLEEHGDCVEAIRHAQAARDWSRAARILFAARVGLILDGRTATLRALLDGFPAGVAASDPEVALCAAGVLVRDGLRGDAERYVAVARRQAGQVPQERRRLYDLELASIHLESARQQADLEEATEAMAELESALEGQVQTEIRHVSEVRALALLSLAATEIWAMRLDEASRHLEEGLAIARRIGRPYLEIGFLANLAIALPLKGQMASTALRLAEDAVALAEEHGLVHDPVVALAFVTGGGSLALLGRFDDAEQWLERAEHALLPDGDPGTELALHHARGLQRAGQGRLDEARVAFRQAQQTQSLLTSQHALSQDVRLELIITLLRAGDMISARDELAEIPASEREQAEPRIATAAVELADGNPQAAIESLAPVIAGTTPVWMPGSQWPTLWALLFDAPARGQLGDTPGAEAALERALELAEPDGLILPFVITPVRELLERHPRHTTKHSSLLATIADVLAGSWSQRAPAAGGLVEELSDAELRVVRYLPTNLRAKEIAAELIVSSNTVRTHLRHIYAKLDAHNRAEAVARARELGLLAQSLHRR